MAALVLSGSGCGGPGTGPRAPDRPDRVTEGRDARAAAPETIPPGIPIDADDAVWGAEDAPVTLVAFVDFQCPHCARANATVARVERDYGPDTLRVVYKHCPVATHPDAAPAALAAQAVRDLAGSDTFFAFARMLFENQRSLGEDDLVRMADAVGVERGMFLGAARSERTATEVRRDLALAARLGVNATPAFRVNGIEVAGAASVEDFHSVIDAELLKARALVKAGTAPADVYRLRVAANLPAAGKPQPAAAPPAVIYSVPVGNSPVLGPADAPVTIVEFSDFQCPFCKSGDAVARQLLDRHPGKIRLVFKHEPLPFHERAIPAAMLAVEARKEHGDKGFWAAHDLLFDSQPKLADADLERIARQLGLDPVRVRTAIEQRTHRGVIAEDMRLADKLGVEATPTFFVNGRKIEGAAPIEEFEALIAPALSGKR